MLGDVFRGMSAFLDSDRFAADWALARVYRWPIEPTALAYLRMKIMQFFSFLQYKCFRNQINSRAKR